MKELKTNKLKELRIKKGLSQLQLSYKAGMSQGAISNLENGKVFAYDGWKKKLAEILEVSEEEIFPND